MPNHEYQRGNAFEKRVMAELVRDGYACWQTRGSKSAADIVCIKINETLAVQVKSGNTWPTHEEWNRLFELHVKYGLVPILATRDPLHPRKIQYERLTEPHKRYGRDWPAEHWTSDTVSHGPAT